MYAWKSTWGTLRYEFLMQIRRPALWLAFLACALLLARGVINQLDNPYALQMHLTIWQTAAMLTLFTNLLLPLGVGILLADRLARDRRTRVEEILNTLPGTLRSRLLGKYLGTMLASLVPAFLVFLFIMSIAAVYTHNLQLLLCGVACYTVMVLPGMCFVAAFSLACPIVIWVPLYQFLFFGYWFWGNLLGPDYGLPTLSGTILTPVGSFIGANLFDVSINSGVQSGSVLGGTAGIVLLVGIAGLVLVALHQFLTWEQTRQ